MSRPEPPAREDFRHWSKATLRWADNDAYGHVNNTVYYQWFDSAVNGWLVERGLLDIANGDPIALVVGTSCDYFASLSYPGEVEIGLAIAAIGRSSVRYRIGVFAPGAARAAAAGSFVHVAVTRAERTPMSWPPEWRAAFETLQS